MIFEVDHLTRYRYSHAVNLSRHILRLTPRCDARQQVLTHAVSIKPMPTQRFDFVDAWGNTTSVVSFTGNTDVLEIQVHMEVQSSPDNALRALVHTEPLTVPPDYGSETAVLKSYLEPIESEKFMQEFTSRLTEQTNGQLVPLLEQLNKRVKQFHRHTVRLEGSAQSPAETLRKKAGVCRDLAMLFIAACRHHGIAARFVSGYQKQPASGNRNERYLHAWTEVYLPGLGWQGYDQTHGLPVVDQHVVVACGATQAATMPVEGSFGFDGDPPESTLETDVRIVTRYSSDR